VAEQASVATEGAGSAAERRPRVLVVDDSDANRFVVVRILETAGFDVAQAATGGDGLRLAAEGAPDVVVLDVHLPDILGFHVVRQLKAHPATAVIPVLMLSASFTTADATALGLESGADAYVTHPVDRSVLVATVRALLRVRRAEDALRHERAEAEAARAEAERAREEAERARAEAERANHAKTEFLAMMSHELRTPLNAIAGYAELLELGVRGELTEVQRTDVARIRRSQQHLLALINDILNFARLETGHVAYHIRDVALGAVLAEIQELIEPQRRAKKIEYLYAPCDPRLLVRADRDRLEQVLVNLLSNAVKYTGDGGTIRVTVACSADDTTASVSVADTGRGIPADQLDRIFEPFVQVGRSTMSGSQQGVGLGLSISRELARAMGGELTAESRVGEGSVFTLTLPRA
jgi:signal transduction histidine kinase